MLTLLQHLYTSNCGWPEYNLALLGLHQTGKTQIYQALKDRDSTYMVGIKQPYRATVGLNTAGIRGNKYNFFLWDLGGKVGIRKIWQSYYPQCHGVIYLFDDRIDEGIECLCMIFVMKRVFQHIKKWLKFQQQF